MCALTATFLGWVSCPATCAEHHSRACLALQQTHAAGPALHLDTRHYAAPESRSVDGICVEVHASHVGNQPREHWYLDRPGRPLWLVTGACNFGANWLESLGYPNHRKRVYRYADGPINAA